MKVAFVGSGNMASALIGGLIRQGIPPGALYAIDPDEAARNRVSTLYGVTVGAKIGEDLAAYDAVVLAVKPQALARIACELAPILKAQLVVTIAAGIRAADLSRWLGGYGQIVRAMPNTPALIGLGLTGLAALPAVDDDRRKLASRLLEAVGQVAWFNDEDKIDAVTAISGSGPAYVFYFIEAMQQAALELGMTEEQGRVLAVATFLGAAQLAAQSNDSPFELRERVTSKGGTTAAALASFDASGIKDRVIRGIFAAHARAIEMGRDGSAAR